MSAIRENWRIVLLSVLIVLSSVALLVPGATVAGGGDANATDGTNGTAADESFTNLQYGIQLDGGSRIRAPVVGITAENVEVSAGSTNDLAQNVSSALEIDRIDVAVRPQGNTVEVFDRNVTRTELATVLQEQGYDVAESDVREGVTDATRTEMVDVIDRKLQVSALSGADVREAQSPTGENYIVIEATGRDIDDLRSTLSERGVVEVFSYYPAANGSYARERVLTQDEFANVGSVRQQSENEFGVSVTVADSAAEGFLEDMREAGFTQGSACRYDEENPNQTTGRCLLATLNGEVVFDAGVEPGLAESFRTGSFVNDPTFVMTTGSRDEARGLELNLKAGQPLPAPLNFEEAQTSSLQPALADRFKTNSLITGLLAVLAVSAVVYARYRDVRVAGPMVVTAMSEVLLLLGFVAAVQFPMDLSHIAGFIAVIGTGVDDLIIIADEILQQKGVATGRVFQNRFRKAFWVIGAAAATTIIAMSPLTVLSLGDLTGFAIVTIIGVLIGVLVTRPAYGDILRHLVLDEERDG